jgi:hypothetical protein
MQTEIMRSKKPDDWSRIGCNVNIAIKQIGQLSFEQSGAQTALKRNGIIDPPSQRYLKTFEIHYPPHH